MSKILLIDDEPDILRLLAMSLRADGHDVLTARDGETGLAAFAAQGPEIVLIDIKMPGMDGIEVLRQIKDRETDAEVIIITGHGDVDNAIEALKLGASDFLNKPVRDATLTLALNRAQSKIDIRRQLRDYTSNLEHKIAAATQALQRQAHFQAKLINSSDNGIVATDRNQRIVIYNPGAERIFGHAAAQVLERMHLADLFPAELAREFAQGLRRDSKRREMPWRETVVVSAAGEAIPVRFSGSILREKGRKMGSVAFFADLREIKALEAELVHKERLAAIGQTIAGVAHGIKNILHGLNGGSHLVDVGIQRQDSERLTRGWDMVKRNIARTADLVMDLLSYAKERSPDFEDCAPNEIVREVFELVREKAVAADVALALDLDPAIGRAALDQRSLHSVLLNLLSNAVDACRDDPDADKRRQVILRSAREAADWLRFEVTDNGHGMTEEIRRKHFHSFFSTKGPQGTGLGLMVARKAVEEHGGRIEVNSAPGRGTTFTVHLPCRAAGA